MADSRWVQIDVLLIKRETAKAFLCEVEEEGGEVGEYWLPKSQIKDADDYSKGDENLQLSITEWIAAEKGLA